jgi:carbamate kinase
MREDGARDWRHLVASPQPRHVCDILLVDVLASRSTIVIAGGGSGIPIVRDAKGVGNGVEAVIDKDFTIAYIAVVLGFETIMLLTAVPKVAVNFGKRVQKFLDRVSLGELKKLQAEGNFPGAAWVRKLKPPPVFSNGRWPSSHYRRPGRGHAGPER